MIEELTTRQRINYIRDLIYQRKHITTAEIAKLTGRSIGTTRHDIKVLKCEMPIETRSGPDGGVFLVEEKMLRRTITHSDLLLMEYVLEHTDFSYEQEVQFKMLMKKMEARKEDYVTDK